MVNSDTAAAVDLRLGSGNPFEAKNSCIPMFCQMSLAEHSSACKEKPGVVCLKTAKSALSVDIADDNSKNLLN